MAYTSEKMQSTINERLKILISQLKITVRAFSNTLEVPESSTRNYLDKGTKLNAEYLEKIAHHFKSVNLTWLITGVGEPLLQGPEGMVPLDPHVKNNSGNSIGINRGKATQQQGAGPTSTEAELLLKIQHLEAQLAMKDQVIASKDETIDLLKAAFNRPN